MFFLKRPVLGTAILSLVVVCLATIGAAWGYEAFGKYNPGVRYQIIITVIIASILAPTFLYPFIIVAARLRNATGKLKAQANTDALTGLGNVAALFDELSCQLERTSGSTMLAVHFIDLDRFKEVNDTLGHPAGDALLLAVSKRLLVLAGHDNIVARFGGDEFVVVQTEVRSRTDADDFARSAAEFLSWKYEIGGHEIHAGVTIGVALAPPDGREPSDLLRAADMALYRAKVEARGAWLFFDPVMDIEVQARRSLELDLRAALDAKQFEVHYQPLFEPQSLKVTTCEALLRWHHPERGDVPPEVFIPAAERIGSIHEIGAWVLDQACNACVHWPDDVRVAVNLSPAQFTRGNVVGAVAAALARSGLAAHRLELEITETVLLRDLLGVRLALEQLRGLGVRISLDDFGTGYSGLNYLHRFRLDKVKIDRQFVREITSNDRSLLMLRGVARLSAELGMSVAVEGIETEEQAQMLAGEPHIDELQGFLFCPPVTRTALAEILGATSGRSAAVPARRMAAPRDELPRLTARQ
jgi:diguanylate cyclase (GGDEF)-like protein